MRYYFLTFIILSFPIQISVAQNIYEKPSKDQPSKIARCYSMFIHFGINTFNQVECSKGDLLILSLNPTNLNCDQWIKTVKKVVFRHIILATKHQPGFCLWDSKHNNYDGASASDSPNHTSFPTTVIEPGKIYTSTITHTFKL